MKLSPLSTSVESLPSDPEPPDEVVLGRAQPGRGGRRARGCSRGSNDPPERGRPPGCDGPRGGPPRTASDADAGTTSERVLWVSDGATARSLPPQLSVEPLDLTTVDVGRQRPVAMGEVSAACVLDGVLERVEDPGSTSGVGLPEARAWRTPGSQCPGRPPFQFTQSSVRSRAARNPQPHPPVPRGDSAGASVPSRLRGAATAPLRVRRRRQRAAQRHCFRRRSAASFFRS